MLGMLEIIAWGVCVLLVLASIVVAQRMRSRPIAIAVVVGTVVWEGGFE